MIWFVFSLIAAFFLGINKVASKKVLMHEHAAEFLTATSLVVFVLTLFFLPKMHFDYSLDVWLLMCLKGILFTFAMLFTAKSLRHLEISYVTPLLNLSPVFLLLWGVLFLDEILSLRQYFGLSLLIFSAYWLQSGHSFRKLLNPLTIFRNKFSLFILLSVFLHSVCSVIDKIVLKKADPYTFLSVTFFVLSFNYLFIQFFKYGGLRDIKHAFVKGKHLIFFIAVLMLLSDVFYYLAVSVPGAMVSLIVSVKRASVLVSTIIGGRLFHDHEFSYRIAASVIMIVGVLLVLL